MTLNVHFAHKNVITAGLAYGELILSRSAFFAQGRWSHCQFLFRFAGSQYWKNKKLCKPLTNWLSDLSLAHTITLYTVFQPPTEETFLWIKVTQHHQNYESRRDANPPRRHTALWGCAYSTSLWLALESAMEDSDQSQQMQTGWLP